MICVVLSEVLTQVSTVNSGIPELAYQYEEMAA